MQIRLPLGAILAALLLALSALLASGCGSDELTARVRGDVPADAAGYPRLFIDEGEIDTLRERIGDPDGLESRVFAHVRHSADEGLSRDPDPDFPDDGPWQETYYAKGQIDSGFARDMAMAYVLSGDELYAEGVRRYLMAWVDRVEPAPTYNQVGAIVGFALMLEWAYDLTYDSRVYSDSDRQALREWFTGFAEAWASSAQGSLAAGQWGSREGEPVVGRDGRLHRENMGTWSSAYAAVTGFMFDDDALVRFGVDGDRRTWLLEPGYAPLTDLAGYPESTANPQAFRPTLLVGMYDDGTLWDEHVRLQLGYPTWQLQALSLIAEAGVRNGAGMSLWNEVLPARASPDNAVDHSLALGFDRYGPFIAGRAPDPYADGPGARDERFWRKASTYYELAAKRLGPRRIPGAGGLTYADVRDSRERATAEDYHLFGLTIHLVGAAGA